MLIKTLKRAGIGFLLGMAVGNLIAFIFVTAEGGGAIVSQKVMDMCGGETEALLLQSFLSGVIGFAGCAGMSFYEIESWSLLRVMASHLGVIFAVFLPVAFLLNWGETLFDFLFLGGMMLVSYFITWLVICAIYKAQVRELNDMQLRLGNGEANAGQQI